MAVREIRTHPLSSLFHEQRPFSQHLVMTGRKRTIKVTSVKNEPVPCSSSGNLDLPDFGLGLPKWNKAINDIINSTCAFPSLGQRCELVRYKRLMLLDLGHTASKTRNNGPNRMSGVPQQPIAYITQYYPHLHKG